MAAIETTRERQLQGRHVLFAFLGFFGVIFAVNGYFLYSALGTYTGVVSQEPYRKGLLYNERIAEDERQTALGWTQTVSTGADGKVLVTMVDSAGLPVVGLRINGTLGRPSTNAFDRRLDFAEAAPGQYVAASGMIESGAWIASIEAYTHAAERPAFRGRSRLWLKP